MRKEALEEQIELLEKQQNAIQEMIDKSNDYFDKLMESLDDTRTRWEELSELQSNAKMLEDMEDVFNELGYTSEQVLSMSDETFSAFSQKYMDYMNGVKDESESVKTALSTMADVGDMEWLQEYLDKSALGVADIAAVDLTGAVDSINGVSDGLNGVMESANEASNAIGGVSSSNDKDNEKSDKQQSESTSLTTAIVETYDTANATLPSVAGMFDGITSSANASTNAVRELKAAIEDLGNAQSAVPSVNITTGKIDGYASGAEKIDEDKNAWTQEYGAEVIVSPSRNAIYTPLKAGDSVLTAEMTKNLWEWGKMKPNLSMVNMGLPNVITPDTTNINNASSSVTIENITISCPNVTNNSGAEYIQKELTKLGNKLSIGKYQYFNKI